jgi:hypothetical protein
MENRAYNTPQKDLMNKTLEHYEEASNAIFYWNSDVPKAIKKYYLANENSSAKFLLIVLFCGLILGIAIGLAF